MDDKAFKFKQREKLLSRKIQNIYTDRLQHQLDDISYKFFDSTLVVILEGTITSSEKLLKDNDRFGLAEQVRDAIDLIIQPQLKKTIEEVLNVRVIDFLSDTTIDHNLTWAIAIFEFK